MGWFILNHSIDNQNYTIIQPRKRSGNADSAPAIVNPATQTYKFLVFDTDKQSESKGSRATYYSKKCMIDVHLQANAAP